MKYSLSVLIVLIGLIFFACTEKTPADLVLMNGEVYTMEPDLPWASTVVISGNKITGVLGKEVDFRGYVG